MDCSIAFAGKTTFQKNVINSKLLHKEILHNAVVSLFCL